MRPKFIIATLLLVAAGFLTGCGTMVRAPANTLEAIEAAEVTAQEVSASVVNLTCTKFVAKKCVEPGKAFSPDQGSELHAQVQDARRALRVAKDLKDGQIGECLGQTRSQVACLNAVKALLAQIETRILQAQGGRP